ncbi:MAG: orotidine 5'-phosphate decarboxylase, partial [Nitrospirae bacterium]|nr:orotidine 5'-phosphate decarboxylase [Nitrospirota bacterium]
MKKKPHQPTGPDRAEKERARTVPPPPRRPRDRILVALDVQTLKEADDLVDRLHDVVGGFKVGHQLFTAHGPKAIHHIRGKAGRIFLDLKYHDIPATVAKSACEAARLGVWMMTVHAAGG